VLVYASEERFERTLDGRVYSPNGFGEAFWARYLRIFPKLRIIGRVAPVDEPHPTAVPLQEEVDFHPLPSFARSRALLNAPTMLSALRSGLEGADAYAIRSPGLSSLLVERHIRRSEEPFAVELVADPAEALAWGRVNAVTAAARPIVVQNARRLCLSADAVAYVTGSYLQKRYPSASGAILGSFSDAMLGPHHVVTASRPAQFFAGRPFQMLFVGSLQQPYKGADILIEAVRQLARKGFPLSLRIAGEGRLRRQLEQKVRSYGLTSIVDFLGRISRDQVIAEMDTCHLLVQPSRSEGLPRTVVEALGRATPMLGSDVGGMNELIPPEQLCEQGDPTALADAIRRFMDDPKLLAASSANNLASARRFAPDVLEESFSAFWSSFREIATPR
jgi:glycosyltransferase involved in cell wall biosynthesis